MTTSRLEAFSDGVLAIIITIMVLGLEVPKGDDLQSLVPLIPRLLNYLLSFIYVGIYWNNHHHLFQVIQKVNGTVLWLNLLLLFFLSLLPIATNWLGEHDHSAWPVVVYGVILFLSSIAFALIEKYALRLDNQNEALQKSFKNRKKEIASTLLYGIAIALAFSFPYVSIFLYAFVACLWIVPDRRIEKNLG
ncbi:MAG: TMEM175 family protein [Sphingobacterium sp.]|jgi:uncharacterized membrane protein|nr:TMEM175 family protein [Sphingobacterium sp.]